MQIWWLSFCDPDKPEGTRFLGVSIVEAMDFLNAVRIARAHGCNPGGECQGTEITGFKVKEEYMYRLLTKKEADDVILED